MEHRICKYLTHQIKIADEWITLVKCVNCNAIMGLHDKFTCSDSCKKFNCCNDPDPIFVYENDYFKDNKEMKKFIETYCE